MLKYAYRLSKGGKNKMKSKKFLCVTALILTFISIFSIMSCALTTGTVNGSGGNMNMRDGPGTTHKLVVTVPNNTAVVINGTKNCDDGTTNAAWYNVTCKVNGKQYTGYISSVGISNIHTDSSSSSSNGTVGISDAVPDIYETYINNLKKQHPNWKFKFYYTGLNWYDVIKNETKDGSNAIYSTYPLSYRSTTLHFTKSADYAPGNSNIGIINGSGGSLNMRTGPGTKHTLITAINNGTKVTILATVPCDDGTTNGNWYKISVTISGKKYEGYVASNLVKIDSGSGTYSYTPIEGSNWFQAHGQVVSYHIDPRNFLNEKGVFQFEELTYNASVQNLNGVKAIIKGSFMDGVKIQTTDGRSITYAEAFMEAGKKYNVSPYHLASKVIQEVGLSGSKSVTGDNKTYPVYNFYNIGANTGYLDGLKWAYNNNQSGTYGRPWTTQYKSIVGGAEFIASGYISKGQNTTYFEKFDFIADGGLYNHQYATDVTYSRVQAEKTYNSVYSKMLGTDFCFIIPVFRNMPKKVCSLPTGQQPNLTPDCPALTDTVDPKPITGTNTPNPPSPKPEVPVLEVVDARCGDVNGDNKISIVDAKLILQHVAGISGKIIGDDKKIYADMNSDGKITIADAKTVLCVVAGSLDLKVKSSVPNTAVEVKTSDYTFTMPNGWDYSTDNKAFFKKNTDSACYVKIENLGNENAEYGYTLNNFYEQSSDYSTELAKEINSAGTGNTATVSDGTFTLVNGGNSVKYCHYIEYDANKKVVDSQYVAWLLVNKQIICIQYNCNGGLGYDSSFDFTKQIAENFKVK